MYRNKGFTLIEVMVVLSILAIIAILAYNFFGNTMKEAGEKAAVTDIYNKLRTINDAAELYRIKNGTLPVNENALVASGILKATPTLPPSYGVNPYIVYIDDFDSMYPGGDFAAANAGRLKDSICTAFSAAYANPVALQGGMWEFTDEGEVYPSLTYGNGANIFSIRWSLAEVDNCAIVMISEYN